MKHIKFKQFVETFNFRDYQADRTCDLKRMDTVIVRFYKDDNPDDWFELGVYDWSGSTFDRLKKILAKEILKSYVICMEYDYEVDVLKVYLQTEKKMPDNEDEV